MLYYANASYKQEREIDHDMCRSKSLLKYILSADCCKIKTKMELFRSPATLPMSTTNILYIYQENNSVVQFGLKTSRLQTVEIDNAALRSPHEENAYIIITRMNQHEIGAFFIIN